MNTRALTSESLSREKGGTSAARRTAAIVLPIFNEEQNIKCLLDRINNVPQESTTYRIIAVDDGSSDGTPKVLEEYTARIRLDVVRHQINQGLGAAIRSGLMDALRNSSDEDVVVTMDADESHAPVLISEMLKAIDSGFDVIIASRFQPGSSVRGVPLHRQILSVGASILFRTIFPTRGVRDFTCGYRAYRVSILRKAVAKYGDSLFEQTGFQCMVDLLLKLRATNARFSEVPFILRYDLKKGHSKMRVFQTTVRTLKLILTRRLGF